jgi:hypothetical protein
MREVIRRPRRRGEVKLRFPPASLSVMSSVTPSTQRKRLE